MAKLISAVHGGRCEAVRLVFTELHAECDEAGLRVLTNVQGFFLSCEGLPAIGYKHTGGHEKEDLSQRVVHWESTLHELTSAPESDRLLIEPLTKDLDASKRVVGGKSAELRTLFVEKVRLEG